MPHFRIRQKGMTIAQASGPNAESEIMHYAMQYRAEGELTIQAQHRSPSGGGKWKWKRWMLMAQWPDESAVG